MSKVALDGVNINSSTASNHIEYRKWEYQYTTKKECVERDKDGNCIKWTGGDKVYDWEYYKTSATIDGTCNSSMSSVKINGSNPVVNGDNTSEKDTYTIPSGEYYSGEHTSATGNVTSGNSNNVYANGKSVSIVGSSINTHASTSTNIGSSGSSSNVNIG